MADIASLLRDDFQDFEFAEGYADSFLDSYIATQIKVLREQRGMTQADLAKAIRTTQTAISRIERVNYSNWSLRTLKKLAHAFQVRLSVSFETFGTLIGETEQFSRESLQRQAHHEDLGLKNGHRDYAATTDVVMDQGEMDAPFTLDAIPTRMARMSTSGTGFTEEPGQSEFSHSAYEASHG